MLARALVREATALQDESGEANDATGTNHDSDDSDMEVDRMGWAKAQDEDATILEAKMKDAEAALLKVHNDVRRAREDLRRYADGLFADFTP